MMTMPADVATAPAMADPAADTPTPTVLEEKQRFSRSCLWQLQRNFFEQQGIRAWQLGIVPHYVTSNPHVANAYAQVVLGFLRDCQANGTYDPTQPLYIVELGAGSGRFAYHFLQKFHPAYTQSSLRQGVITYLLTDFTEQNLNYWQAHPSLQSFLTQGLLDVARFDAENDHTLTLQRAGNTLTAASLKNPLIVIANYVLDTLPQDLFFIEKGHIYESLITLTSSQAEPDLSAPEILQRLTVNYTQQPLTGDFYEEAAFNQILQNYQQTLADTYLLFPMVALRSLNRLRQLCDNKLLFLSGDKGYSQEEDLLFLEAPSIVRHGSFSLMVNYHAVGQYVQQQGGIFLNTPHRHNSLNICAAVFGPQPPICPETRLAFTTAMTQNSPDDFFTLKRILEKHYDQLEIEQFLAYLRLSGWDANVFLDCFSAIMPQLESAPEALREELAWAVDNIWETYYPIGEARDLAFYLGMLLYALERYPEALSYLQRSHQLYGDDPSTLYNMGLCYYRLRQLDRALECMTYILEHTPEFEPAKAMRIKLRAEMARRPVPISAGPTLTPSPETAGNAVKLFWER